MVSLSKGLVSSNVGMGMGLGESFFSEFITNYIFNNYSPDEPCSDKFPDEKYF